MKRPISIFLLFVFLLGTAGVSVVRHYCKGSFAGASFAWSSLSKGCEMSAGTAACNKLRPDCCKTEISQVLVKDKFSPATSSQVNVSIHELLFDVSTIRFIDIKSIVVVSQQDNLPPDIMKAPEFSGIFRI